MSHVCKEEVIVYLQELKRHLRDKTSKMLSRNVISSPEGIIECSNMHVINANAIETTISLVNHHGDKLRTMEGQTSGKEDINQQGDSAAITEPQSA